jgi:hypothetical protein
LDLRSEININARFHQPQDSTKPSFSGEAKIWNTSAYAIGKYRVQLPAIALITDGTDAELNISRSQIGNSFLQADLRALDILDKLHFDGSELHASLDVSDILPQMQGIVKADVFAGGDFDEPEIDLSASSHRFAYQNWDINDITLNAAYRDDVASIVVADATWQNQLLDMTGTFAPKTLSFNAKLNTTPIDSLSSNLAARGSIGVQGTIIKPYPMIQLSLENVNLRYGDIFLENVNGSGTMIPADNSLLASLDLESEDSFSLSAVGDVLSQHIAMDLELSDVLVAEMYQQKHLMMLDPNISGKISAIMSGKEIWYQGDLFTRLNSGYDYETDLNILGNVFLEDLSVTASIQTTKALFNDLPANMNMDISYNKRQLKVWKLVLEDMLNLSGNINFDDIWNSYLDIGLSNIDSKKVLRYYPPIAHLVPDFAAFNLFAKYNQAGTRHIESWINFRDADLISLVPISTNIYVQGNPEALMVEGDISSHNKKLLSLTGESSLLPKLNLAVDLKMNDLKLQEVLVSSPALASISGTAQFAMQDMLSKNAQMEIAADVSAKDIKVGDLLIEKAVVKAAQLNDALIVDSLYVSSKDLFTAQAQGSLNYNAIKNTYFEGDRRLNLSIDGKFFPWLKNLTDYIRESDGISNVYLSLGTNEEQFVVHSGAINLDQGYIHLKDQVEPMREIELKGVFENNRFMIQRGSFLMGNGRFYINNLFDSEPSDHFMVSFLDIGYFRILIEEPGIQATIPVVAPPKTLSSIAIRGQDSRYATIRGPFDDMKIDALVIASNLDILFPPGADNLLNLIMSFRSTGEKPDTEPTPLPFKLDLQLIIGENVRYVTYPTNFYLAPGGYLHLIYDGNRFIVEEANIVSDRGSVDFFGTVFQVEEIAITMIDQQNILSVDGTFYKRTPDGSTITLRAVSSNDYSKSFFERLQISLTSDNPQDQNIYQVLSRLRYNQTMDELPENDKDKLLQDEALGLIGGNLNSTVLTPFFYPVENWIRRTLKLDGFSINAGFIQNIFSEYSSNPSGLADMADLSNLSSDITQFSSSILLNNLSVSLSKYVGYRMFVDYEFGLQEATDLQQKTRILVSHDTSLRLVLPRQYRLGYTLNYRPEEQELTHELMLQKSWRFWGF